MATTVHIPPPLLQRVDARAKALGVSRNRLVVEALEDKLATKHEWPAELVAALMTPVSPQTGLEAERMERAIYKARRSRRRPLSL